jgi:thioredoxin reductase
VLIATGLVDELPAIDGLRERWGRDVVLCPYCHGYEVRDQPIAVIATSPRSVHQALMVRQWSADVVLLENTVEFGDDDLAKLAARDIRIVEGKVDGLEVVDDRITGVRLASGEVVARSVVFVAPYFRATVPQGLDLDAETTDMATHLVVDGTGRTSVAGVWAAGNVAEPMGQVIIAAAAGSKAAADINAHLVEQDIAVAMTAGAA